MLILTGVMLGFVLLVMVGEQAQEMQLAHWIPTTQIGWLKIPDWAGLWFSIFPTVETLVAQLLAAFFVVGSYFLARRKTAVVAGRSWSLNWCQREDLNLRPKAYESSALPLSYAGKLFIYTLLTH